jgi:hypothetical protein
MKRSWLWYLPGVMHTPKVTQSAPTHPMTPGHRVMGRCQPMSSAHRLMGRTAGALSPLVRRPGGRGDLWRSVLGPGDVGLGDIGPGDYVTGCPGVTARPRVTGCPGVT